MLVNATVSDFYTGEEQALTVPLKVPIFKGSQKYNIGLGIHRLMKRVKDLVLNSSNQYSLAKIILSFQERKLIDDSLIRNLQRKKCYLLREFLH